MNWLLFVVIIVVLGFAYNGYRKGLVSMILSVGTLIFSIIITGFLGPIFSESLCGSQIIMGYVSEQVNENLAIEQTMNNAIDVATGKNIKDNMAISSKLQENIIEQLELPDLISSSVLDGTAEIVNTAGKVTVKKFSNYLCNEIARFIIRGITYIVLIIIIRILLKIIVKVFKVVDKIPVLEDISQLAGGVTGAIIGFVVVWVGFLFLLAFSGTSFGISCYQCINESSVLSFMYNNNLLLKWILASVNG